MSHPPDPLDALGRDLGAALRRELPVRRSRRRRTLLTAGAMSLAIAVPAAGTATNWAGLAGGQTALPTQVAAGLRVRLAGGRDERGPWRLEAYRARLDDRTGVLGVCVFLSRENGGSGRCVPEGSRMVLVDAGSDSLAGLAGGAVRGTEVVRLELRLGGTSERAGRVVAVLPAPAPVAELRARGLPTDLRSYAVLLDPRDGPVLGVRAVDRDGRTVATAGRPGAPAPQRPLSPSPVPSTP